MGGGWSDSVPVLQQAMAEHTWDGETAGRDGTLDPGRPSGRPRCRGASAVVPRVDDVVDKAKAQTGLTSSEPTLHAEVLVRWAEKEARSTSSASSEFMVKPLVNRLVWFHASSGDRGPGGRNRRRLPARCALPPPKTPSLPPVGGTDPRARRPASRPRTGSPAVGEPGPGPHLGAAAVDAAAVGDGHDDGGPRPRMWSSSPQDLPQGVRTTSTPTGSRNCDMSRLPLQEACQALQWKTRRRCGASRARRTRCSSRRTRSGSPDAPTSACRRIATCRRFCCWLSACIFTAASRMGNSDMDPLYVGELDSGGVGISLYRCLAFREDPERDARIFDIGFTEFQADPTRNPRLYELARRRSDRTRSTACSLAGRQPEGQARQARVQRCRLRRHAGALHSTTANRSSPVTRFHRVGHGQPGLLPRHHTAGRPTRPERRSRRAPARPPSSADMTVVFTRAALLTNLGLADNVRGCQPCRTADSRTDHDTDEAQVGVLVAPPTNEQIESSFASP